jgi:hypothetical protein
MGKRTLIGIPAPVVATPPEPRDMGKTPPEPFASRRPPPSAPPPPPEPTESVVESSPPPVVTAGEHKVSRPKSPLAATRKETPEALAAAKAKAREHASSMAPSSDPPRKRSFFGPVFVMLVIAAVAIWFLVGNQRATEQAMHDAEKAADRQGAASSPDQRDPLPAAAPAPEPTQAPAASAVAEPQASASAPSPAAPTPDAPVPSADAVAEKAPPASSAASPDGTRVVIVTLSPPDARLFYKGKSLGKSPYRIELKPGEKKRSFEAGGFGYVTRRITVDGSEPELSVGLRPDPNARSK